MTYTLLHDVEKGIVGMFGGPEEIIDDVEKMDPELSTAIDKLLGSLGLGGATTDQTIKSVGYELLTKSLDAVESVSAAKTDTTAHADAGAPKAASAADSMGVEPTETAAATDSAAEGTQTASEATLETTTTPAPAEAASGLEDTPLRDPAPGFTVCPTCEGWREAVGPSGSLAKCGTCQGQGQVPVHREQPPAETA